MPPANAAMNPLPPSPAATAKARIAVASGRICRHPPPSQPRRSAKRNSSPPPMPATRPPTRPQPIWEAALCSTAEGTPPLSSAFAMSRATRKKGTARPSLSPLSTSSAWRTRGGTAWSVTTFCPSAASVAASMVDSRKTEPNAMPGNTSRPTPTPASNESGSPMSSRRTGHESSCRSDRRSRRIASLNSSNTSASSVILSATTLSSLTSNRPSADTPTARPASMNTIAEVTPRRSSGLEKADHRMRITATVPSASIPPAPPPRARLRRPRQSYTVAAEQSANAAHTPGACIGRVGCSTTTKTSA